MDNNTLLQTIRTQGEQAQLMVEQTKALEQMIEEMTNLRNEMNITASKTNTRLSEVEILVEEVNKKVHIDDVEASEIKSIISKQANEFANQYFESKNEIPSANLFASKKGQFIRTQHSRLKHHFNVTKYTHIKHTEAEKAFNYLKSLSLEMFSPFETRITPKQLEIIELEKTID